jgi:VanZ family protein
VLTCLGISLAYGVCDEFHQLLVPGRYASLLDMGLNLVGVSVATLVFVLWNRSIKGAEG